MTEQMTTKVHLQSSDDDARKVYMDWLRGEVQKHCNADGLYEAYWDHDDAITPDQMMDAWKNYSQEGYATPMDHLENMLYTGTGVDMENYFYSECLLHDLDSAPEVVRECWDATESVFDDLEKAGYNGVDVNIDQLLRQSSFAVNVFLATEAERNFDMGSIVDSFGNDYRAPEPDMLDANDLDNALSYLIHQQGHTVSEVYGGLLLDESSDSEFIESVVSEIEENSSEAMSEVAALVRMDGGAMLSFLAALEEPKDSLVLPKDSATIGIFNQWSGCGGPLDIRLERDAVIPLSLVREFQIEGQSSPHGYTVDDVYGLVNSVWTPNASIREGVAPVPVQEDYAGTLAQVQRAMELKEASEMMQEDREARAALAAEQPGVDLRTESKSARAASSKLANTTSPDVPVVKGQDR